MKEQIDEAEALLDEACCHLRQAKMDFADPSEQPAVRESLLYVLALTSIAQTRIAKCIK